MTILIIIIIIILMVINNRTLRRLINSNKIIDLVFGSAHIRSRRPFGSLHL